MALEAIAGFVLLVFMILGVALVFLGFPGTYFLLFGAVFYNVITWSTAIGAGTMIVLASLVAFGELFNAFVNAAGNKVSSSFIGNTGALLGSVGGAVAGISQGIFGILLGLFVGGAFVAFVFELVHYFSIRQASRASFGAFFGRTMSIFVKFEVAMIMLVAIVLGVVF